MFRIVAFYKQILIVGGFFFFFFLLISFVIDSLFSLYVQKPYSTSVTPTHFKQSLNAYHEKRYAEGVKQSTVLMIGTTAWKQKQKRNLYFPNSGPKREKTS